MWPPHDYDQFFFKLILKVFLQHFFFLAIYGSTAFSHSLFQRINTFVTNTTGDSQHALSLYYHVYISHSELLQDEPVIIWFTVSRFHVVQQTRNLKTGLYVWWDFKLNVDTQVESITCMGHYKKPTPHPPRP